MSAVMGGDTKVVQILLEAGADLNAVNKKRKSALMLAKKEGYTPIVNLLRDAGAEE